jgi:hypothetical protein
VYVAVLTSFVGAEHAAIAAAAAIKSKIFFIPYCFLTNIISDQMVAH